MLMLWSSYYPNQIDKIPSNGDRVIYPNEIVPWTVERRIIHSGNVLLTLRNGDRIHENVQLEILNWFPEVGDWCNIAMQPYLNWRKIYNDFALPKWFWLIM